MVPVLYIQWKKSCYDCSRCKLKIQENSFPLTGYHWLVKDAHSSVFQTNFFLYRPLITGNLLTFL
jgi:hypothetical protein